ncbi:MAG: M20/M25/M40 family metallo-hydrolase [Candidatus Bathyarchaeia archaeon]
MGVYTRREAVDTLSRMLEIYSPTGSEGELADFIYRLLVDYGLNAVIDSVGNVIASIGYGDPKILLCGHMDTIPGYIPVKVRNTRIYGRGAVDAKGPLASMISASIAASYCKLDGTIMLACVVDEEGGSKGISKLIDDGVKVDYAVFGEPSGTYNITVGYKGSMHVKLMVKGIGGHASAPWLFDNPLEAIFEAYRSVREKVETFIHADDRFYKYSVALTMVKGGVAVNVIPSEAEGYLDIRLPPGSDPTSIYEVVKQEVLKTTSKYRRVKLNMELYDLTPPYEERCESRLVKAFQDAIKSELNIEPGLLRKSGTSDMNIYAARTNISSIAYGPGNPRLSHRNIEWIEMEDYLCSVKILLKALSNLVGLDLNEAYKIFT